jgi:predicted TIM-barrel fold metal-dependent hydrolase
VQDDLANGVEYPHSSVGQPLHFAENDALRPLLSIVHVASLITHGIHDRLPNLRFVFGDGGVDLAAPVLWRLDNDWRNGRVEVPWIDDLPSVIAGRFTRFVSQAQDGTADGVHPADALRRISQADSRLLFGSHRPYWDVVDASQLVDGWEPEPAANVLAHNALAAIPRLARFLTG